jgi:hypothetical protein
MSHKLKQQTGQRKPHTSGKPTNHHPHPPPPQNLFQQPQERVCRQGALVSLVHDHDAGGGGELESYTGGGLGL